MSLLDPVEVPPLNPITRSLPAIAGLLTSGAVVAFAGSLLPPHTLSWTQLLGTATERIGLASLACAVTVSALAATSSRLSRLESTRLVIQTSQAAIWLAPLALFIREDSFWTIAATAFFSVIATRLFYTLQESPGPTSSEELFLLTLHPDTPPPLFPFRPRTSTAAALCAQIGALGILAGLTLAGAVLVALAFSLWTWVFAPNAASDQPASSYSFPYQPRTLLALTLAILFMIAGLVPFLRVTRSGGRYGTATSTHHWYAFPAPGQRQRPPDTKTSEDAGARLGGGDPGIILSPSQQTYTKLIAPLPTLLTGPHTNRGTSNPLVIPFNGVYWFFKSPDVQPPQASRQAHASPEKVDIRSTDRRPLSIEAHDYLGTLFNLDCCSRIQIAIRNADRYPETVSLELVLLDTSLRAKPSQSLGRIMVRSTPPWDLHKVQPPVDETLNFPIPLKSALRHFDAVKVVFRLDRARADAAAKIAIDHLVLIPRGL